MFKYIKCPRCDLNYIDGDKQEYCDICIAEMKGNKLQFADLDDDELEAIDAELETEEICPVCGVTPLRIGEKMCESCRQQQDYQEEEEVDIEKDEEWKSYLDEDDSDLTIDEELDEELKAEFEKEEEEDEMYEGEDDFYESEDVDSLDDLEDDDFEDDEDDFDDDF